MGTNIFGTPSKYNPFGTGTIPRQSNFLEKPVDDLSAGIPIDVPLNMPNLIETGGGVGGDGGGLPPDWFNTGIGFGVQDKYDWTRFTRDYPDLGDFSSDQTKQSWDEWMKSNTPHWLDVSSGTRGVEGGWDIFDMKDFMQENEGFNWWSSGNAFEPGGGSPYTSRQIFENWMNSRRNPRPSPKPPSTGPGEPPPVGPGEPPPVGPGEPPPVGTDPNGAIMQQIQAILARLQELGKPTTMGNFSFTAPTVKPVLDEINFGPDTAYDYGGLNKWATTPVEWTPDQIKNMYSTQFQDLETQEGRANQDIADFFKGRFQGRSGEMVNKLLESKHDFSRSRQNVISDVLGKVLPAQEQLSQGRQGLGLQGAQLSIQELNDRATRASTARQDALAQGNFELAAQEQMIEIEAQQEIINLQRQKQGYEQAHGKSELGLEALKTFLSQNLGEQNISSDKVNDFYDAMIGFLSAT